MANLPPTVKVLTPQESFRQLRNYRHLQGVPNKWHTVCRAISYKLFVLGL